MIIKKKTWPKLFQKILIGDKTFDLRLADWQCNPGDILEFEEWDPKTKKYTGRKISKEVTFVLKTKELDFWPQDQVEKFGYLIISFK